jgi:hypothetical protein
MVTSAMGSIVAFSQFLPQSAEDNATTNRILLFSAGLRDEKPKYFEVLEAELMETCTC